MRRPTRSSAWLKRPTLRLIEGVAEPVDEPAAGADLEQLTAAMQLIPNDGAPDWHHWSAVGMAVWAATGGSDAGRALWLAWSAKNPCDGEKYTAAGRWDGFSASPPTSTGINKLISLATAAIRAPAGGSLGNGTGNGAGNGARPPALVPGAAGGIPDDDNAVEDPDAPPPERPVRFSDSALAFLFTDLHGDALRYVPDWGSWWVVRGGMVGEGPHCRGVRPRRRAICAREGNIALDTLPKRGASVAAALNSAATVAAIERLVRRHAPHVRESVEFDADLAAIHARGQAISLGAQITARPATAADCFTRSLSVPPAEGDCPLWRRFLHRIMAGDQAKIDYLQRLSGYCLTGEISEHALIFLYGSGANGKTTFANVLLEIFGDGRTGYAAMAPMTTFTAQKFDQHTTELAMLQGKRLVVATETEEGRAWATARIKQLTGGDKVSARFMRQDFFEFTPQFQLLILGNHKPALRVTDEAMRRRLHLLPFLVTIPAAERDQTLPVKLRAEYPQILAWMLRGCALWRVTGLNPPASVVAATDEYFEDEDTFAQWLAECCVFDPQSSTTLQDLFASWQSWAEANGEYVGNRRQLAQRLDGRPGLARARTPDAGSRLLAWHGLRVRKGAEGTR